MPAITIGNDAVIATSRMVANDVPPHSIVASNPARVVRHQLSLIHI